jgi:hypothetical protein
VVVVVVVDAAAAVAGWRVVGPEVGWWWCLWRLWGWGQMRDGAGAYGGRGDYIFLIVFKKVGRAATVARAVFN